MKSAPKKGLHEDAGFRAGTMGAILGICLLSISCFGADSPGTAPPKIALQSVASGFLSPLGLQVPNDGTNRLFVLEQGGKIRIIQNGVLLKTPFLDLSAIVQTGGEEGLLGMAFHPQYQQNGRFFLNYTQINNNQLQSITAEYHVSANDPNRADPNGHLILAVDKPFPNHNGGQLAFGPDTFLYIGLGDGGSEGDPLKNGQNLTTLLGKILRIDIDSGSPYVIPPDNPFVNSPPDRGEIWAYGLRNPWRFSFDTRTGALFAGDVGQDAWEEIDIIKKGLNYGWNIMEGKHCYPPGSQCDMTGLTLPIAEYPHPIGEAVMGGFVYRGTAIPALQGIYIFGDYIGGQIWGLRQVSPGKWSPGLLLSTGTAISSFGKDASGELYALDYTNGILYKIVAG